MSATDELRELLNNRGVEWKGLHRHLKGYYQPENDYTTWRAGNLHCSYHENGNVRTLTVEGYSATPEQAITVTLGAGTCRWFELFGTPERAARTLYESTSECRCCVIRDQCGYNLDKCVMYDRDKLLEWLRGDA